MLHCFSVCSVSGVVLGCVYAPQSVFSVSSIQGVLNAPLFQCSQCQWYCFSIQGVLNAPLFQCLKC